MKRVYAIAIAKNAIAATMKTRSSMGHILTSTASLNRGFAFTRSGDQPGDRRAGAP